MATTRKKAPVAKKKPTPAQGGTDYIKWVLLAGTAAAVVAIAYLLADRYNLFHRTVDIDRAHFPVQGIDVSKHNGSIDFEAVAAQGYKFVFIKASEGATYRDANFKNNYTGAHKAGLKVGAYHFFRKNRDGEAQAANFVNAVGDCRLDLPLVLDVEDWDNDHFVGNDKVVPRLTAMVKALQGQGLQVMVYTNGDGYRKYYRDHLSHLPLWLCSFTAPDSLRSFGHVFQQYSHWGQVDGIKGDVDLNVFCGSERDWNKQLQQWQNSKQ